MKTDELESGHRVYIHAIFSHFEKPMNSERVGVFNVEEVGNSTCIRIPIPPNDEIREVDLDRYKLFLNIKFWKTSTLVDEFGSLCLETNYFDEEKFKEYIITVFRLNRQNIAEDQQRFSFQINQVGLGTISYGSESDKTMEDAKVSAVLGLYDILKH